METKDTLSSYSNSEEQQMQQIQDKAKESCMRCLLRLFDVQHLSSSNYSMYNDFRDAFHRLFEADERNFKDVLSLNFKDYINMEAHTFKETIIQNMKSIEQCIVERASHEQKLQNGLKSRIVSDKGNDQGLENDKGLENQHNTSRDESNMSRNECNDKSTSGDDTDISPTYDTEPMIEVPYTAKHNVFAVDTQRYEQSESISNTCVVETGDSNVIPDSPDMCDNDIQNDQNVVECDDERVALANLIANLKLDVDENKKIQKQLKKANASLTQELTE
ncbi:hypothetical protein Tco_1065172 [Tanacetum coccineum]